MADVSGPLTGTLITASSGIFESVVGVTVTSNLPMNGAILKCATESFGNESTILEITTAGKESRVQA